MFVCVCAWKILAASGASRRPPANTQELSQCMWRDSKDDLNLPESSVELMKLDCEVCEL